MNGKQYEILGEINRQQRNKPADLKAIYVRSNSGDMIQLDNLIELESGIAPPKLYRYNRFVSATISAGLADGKTIGQGLDEMDKIAKENEISIKNRSNKAKGTGTLTYLMRDLRSKDIKQIEEDYYAQLKSAGTQWAADMSVRALMTNANFDENDTLDIRNKRAALIDSQYAEIDDLKEKNRRLMEMVQKLGGDLSALDDPGSKK